MKILLTINSSPLGTEASVSRQLTAEFVQKWRQGTLTARLSTAT